MKNSILHNQINVTQALIDVDTNHYFDYHYFVPGKFLQAKLLAKHDKVGAEEPDWNWRLTVVQSECKTKFTYRVVCILNKNKHSTYIISNLVTCRFSSGSFRTLCLPEQ